MTNIKQFVPWVALVLSVIVFVAFFWGGSVRSLGAAGNMLAENYIPYVMYNGGYKSDKPIETTSTFAVTGTSAFTGLLSAVTGAFSGAVSTGLLTSGGGVTATTSTGAGTLTAAELFGGNVLEHTNAGATTVTLVASTSVTAYIATAGQCRTVLYKNKGTATDTIAGGTGTLLSVASSTIGIGLKTVSTGGVAHLLMCRTSNTDIEVFMSPAD